MNLRQLILVFCLLSSSTLAQPLYQSPEFTIKADRVEQGQFMAVAESPQRLRSSLPYKMALTPSLLNFKFVLNGQDNEGPVGHDHALVLRPQNGVLRTPVYKFGVVEQVPEATPLAVPLQGGYQVVFRVDMREVLSKLRADGQYSPPAGNPIRSLDSLHIMGGRSPLSWDLTALNDDHRLTDQDGDGVYEVTLEFESPSSRRFRDDGYAVWELSEDLSELPTYNSSQPLVDALYKLSLEEMLQDKRADGAFMAGAKWPGVWTRDISYSILLSLAMLDPEASKASLLAKVREGRIIQDTGTGGSWPISSDRMTWALAAWEVYLVTGDEDWLKQAYSVIRRSVEPDLLCLRDPKTGLFRGESSFLDWREQTYPTWMEPKDIYTSLNLGTNAVHFGTYRVLAQMAEILGGSPGRYERVANGIRSGINTSLWQPNKGYYGQYLYGRDRLTLSPRSETLGSALCILLGVAESEQTDQLLTNLPVTAYGPPCIYPQIPDIAPYHNDGIWPFVAGFWAWAGAREGHSASVEHALASIYRASALGLTNKENMVCGTGSFEGTQLNSDRQLWSVAANLATVTRVFFGMEYSVEGLSFRPLVPRAYQGTRQLEGLRYRGATLKVVVEGFGDHVVSAQLDGSPLKRAFIPAHITGAHTLTIHMNNQIPASRINLVENRFSPKTPVTEVAQDWLRWAPEGRHQVFRNGRLLLETLATEIKLEPGEYQVRRLQDGLASFLSEPVGGRSVEIVSRPNSNGPMRLSREQNRRLELEVDVPATGHYILAACYANGSGPVNTNNKAAIRTLSVDGQRIGALVMPQRGDGAWKDWGYSNGLRVFLKQGPHRLRVTFEVDNENMNGLENTALLKSIRLRLVE